jgi:hypothetical protein
MQLDVRLPIGLMFSLFGGLLALFGLLGDQQIYAQRPMHVNINLYWGLVLLAFGVVMLLLVTRSKSRPTSPSAPRPLKTKRS